MIKNQEFAVNSTNSLRSDMSTFTRLILFDFLSKISIRNSLIFYFRIEILILQWPLFYYNKSPLNVSIPASLIPEIFPSLLSGKFQQILIVPLLYLFFVFHIIYIIFKNFIKYNFYNIFYCKILKI